MKFHIIFEKEISKGCDNNCGHNSSSSKPEVFELKDKIKIRQKCLFTAKSKKQKPSSDGLIMQQHFCLFRRKKKINIKIIPETVTIQIIRQSQYYWDNSGSPVSERRELIPIHRIGIFVGQTFAQSDFVLLASLVPYLLKKNYHLQDKPGQVVILKSLRMLFRLLPYATNNLDFV